MLSCRIVDSGKPQCDLGLSGCNTVQLRGTSLGNIISFRNGREISPVEIREGRYDVVFVIDFPGQEEDNCGVPFQNRAGDLFETFVTNSGLNPDRVYITYIVKCKPPDRKKPSVTQINTCKSHVVDELLCIKPKVVVLVGDTAMRVFNLTGKGGLKNIHGTIWHVPIPNLEDSPTFCVIPVYHPAAIMYNPSEQFNKSIQFDYNRIASIIGSSTIPENDSVFTVPFMLIDTQDKIEWLRDKLKSVPYFAFDTESNGLPWSREKMLCMSFSWAHKDSCEISTAILPLYSHNPKLEGHFVAEWLWGTLPYHEVLSPLKEVFESKDIVKIAHNIKYDMNVLRWYAGIQMSGPIWDTMLMHHMLNETPPHDLEHLADIEFRVGDYSAAKREITGQGKHLIATYSHVPDKILWPYAAADAQCCFNLFEAYYPRLEQQNLIQLYLDEPMPLSYALAEAEWWGNRVHKDVAYGLQTKLEKRSKILEATTREQCHNPIFNPASPDQVAEELIKMGYSESIKDNKNSSGFSTDKNTLSLLANDLPFAGNILEYRTVNKILKTYVTRALTDLDEDGRLRYSFMIHGTKTSRLSCSFLHQLPRPNEIADLRAMLIAEDAFDYTYLDFSQIELRIMAVCSKDQVMLDLFNSGADIHKSTAAAALGLPLDNVSDFNRQVGKAVNFGIIFGSEGYQLVGKLEYEDLEGKRKKLDFKTIQLFIARTKKHFYKMAEYCDNVPLIAMENGGTVISVFGRRRRLGTMLNDYRDGIRKHAEREAVNFTIQGPAFSITARTIVEVKKYLDALIAEGKLIPGDIRLLNSVHDSIAYETKKNLTKWFRGVLRTIAERQIPELDRKSVV